MSGEGEGEPTKLTYLAPSTSWQPMEAIKECWLAKDMLQKHPSKVPLQKKLTFYRRLGKPVQIIIHSKLSGWDMCMDMLPVPSKVLHLPIFFLLSRHWSSNFSSYSSCRAANLLAATLPWEPNIKVWPDLLDHPTLASILPETKKGHETRRGWTGRWVSFQQKGLFPMANRYFHRGVHLDFLHLLCLEANPLP